MNEEVFYAIGANGVLTSLFFLMSEAEKAAELTTQRTHIDTHVIECRYIKTVEFKDCNPLQWVTNKGFKRR